MTVESTFETSDDPNEHICQLNAEAREMPAGLKVLSRRSCRAPQFRAQDHTRLQAWDVPKIHSALGVERLSESLDYD
jgi:hypothetical protein